MIRVDAGRGVAMVAHFKAIRDRPVSKYPSHAVGLLWRTHPVVESPIPVRVARPIPNPTTPYIGVPRYAGAILVYMAQEKHIRRGYRMRTIGTRPRTEPPAASTRREGSLTDFAGTDKPGRMRLHRNLHFGVMPSAVSAARGFLVGTPILPEWM